MTEDVYTPEDGDQEYIDLHSYTKKGVQKPLPKAEFDMLLRAGMPIVQKIQTSYDPNMEDVNQQLSQDEYLNNIPLEVKQQQTADYLTRESLKGYFKGYSDQQIDAVMRLGKRLGSYSTLLAPNSSFHVQKDGTVYNDFQQFMKVATIQDIDNINPLNPNPTQTDQNISITDDTTPSKQQKVKPNSTPENLIWMNFLSDMDTKTGTVDKDMGEKFNYADRMAKDFKSSSIGTLLSKTILPNGGNLSNDIATSINDNYFGLLKNEISQYDISKGNIYYKGKKIFNDATDAQKAMLTNYLSRFKSMGWESDKNRNLENLIGDLSGGFVSLMADMPLFLGAGKALNVAFPALSQMSAGTTGMLTRLGAQWVAGTASKTMLFSMVNAPKTIARAETEGMQAFSEDIYNNAKFAAALQTGEMLGGVAGGLTSKLLQRYATMSEFANTLSRNPQIINNLMQVAGTAVVGYETASGENKYDKFLNAALLTSMHFTNPEAFTNFMVSKDVNRTVMVSDSNFDKVTSLMRSGNSFEQALVRSGVTDQMYYIREGNNLYHINADKFRESGTIEKSGAEPIALDKQTSKQFKYLFQANSYFRQSYSQMLHSIDFEKQAKVIKEQMLDKMNPVPEDFKVLSQDSPEYKAMSDENKEKYDSALKQYRITDYANTLLAYKIASEMQLRANGKYFKRYNLDDVPEITNLLQKASEETGKPVQDIKSMIQSIFGAAEGLTFNNMLEYDRPDNMSELVDKYLAKMKDNQQNVSFLQTNIDQWRRERILGKQERTEEGNVQPTEMQVRQYASEIFNTEPSQLSNEQLNQANEMLISGKYEGNTYQFKQQQYYDDYLRKLLPTVANKLDDIKVQDKNNLLGTSSGEELMNAIKYEPEQQKMFPTGYGTEKIFEGYKPPNPHNDEKSLELGKKLIDAAGKTPITYDELIKAMGIEVPEPLKPLFELAKKLGTKIKVGRIGAQSFAQATPDGKNIVLSMEHLADATNAHERERAGTGYAVEENSILTALLHENIHNVLDNKKSPYYQKIKEAGLLEELGKIRDTVKEYWDNDKQNENIPEQVRRKIEAIFTAVDKDRKEHTAHVSELVAWGLSDPEVAKYLNQIKYSDTTTSEQEETAKENAPNTVFQKIKGWMRKLAGIIFTDKEEQTAFTKMVDLLDTQLGINNTEPVVEPEKPKSPDVKGAEGIGKEVISNKSDYDNWLENNPDAGLADKADWIRKKMNAENAVNETDEQLVQWFEGKHNQIRDELLNNTELSKEDKLVSEHMFSEDERKRLSEYKAKQNFSIESLTQGKQPVKTELTKEESAEIFKDNVVDDEVKKDAQTIMDNLNPFKNPRKESEEKDIQGEVDEHSRNLSLLSGATSYKEKERNGLTYDYEAKTGEPTKAFWLNDNDAKAGRIKLSEDGKNLYWQKTNGGATVLDKNRMLSDGYVDIPLGTLSDFLHHPELFKEYPQLKNLPVYYKNMPEHKATYGFFYDENNNPATLESDRINVDLLYFADKNNLDLTSSILHEVQHAIDNRHTLLLYSTDAVKNIINPEYGNAKLSYESNKDTFTPIHEAEEVFNSMYQNLDMPSFIDNNEKISKDSPVYKFLEMQTEIPSLRHADTPLNTLFNNLTNMTYSDFAKTVEDNLNSYRDNEGYQNWLDNKRLMDSVDRQAYNTEQTENNAKFAQAGYLGINPASTYNTTTTFGKDYLVSDFALTKEYADLRERLKNAKTPEEISNANEDIRKYISNFTERMINENGRFPLAFVQASAERVAKYSEINKRFTDLINRGLTLSNPELRDFVWNNRKFIFNDFYGTKDEVGNKLSDDLLNLRLNWLGGLGKEKAIQQLKQDIWETYSNAKFEFDGHKAFMENYHQEQNRNLNLTLDSFFYNSEKRVEKIQSRAITVDQARAMFDDLTDAERRVIGVDLFLAGKQKVSKADLLDWVRANQLKVDMVLHQDINENPEIIKLHDELAKLNVEKIQPLDKEILDLKFKKDDLQLKLNSSRHLKNEKTSEYYYDLSNEELSQLNKEIQITSKTMMDKEREVGLLYDKRTELNVQINKLNKDNIGNNVKYKPYTTKGNAITNNQEWLFRYEGNTNGDTSHWSENRKDSEPIPELGGYTIKEIPAGIFAHARVNDANLTTGEKVLHLDELQSQQANQTDKQNYESSIKQSDWNDNDIARQVQSGKAEPELLQEKSFTESRQKELPNPFYKNWYEFVLKKALHHASTQGYDGIAWITGKTQADRYNLIHYIDGVEYNPVPDNQGRYMIMIIPKDHNPETPLSIKHYSTEELKRTFGKELSEKMLNQEGERLQNSNRIVLSGDNLSVGGQGKDTLYDEMIPNYLSKYLKQYGVKPELRDIVTSNDKIGLVPPEEVNVGNEIERGWREVNQIKTVIKTQQSWYIPITDKMRETFQEAQPMFGSNRNLNLSTGETGNQAFGKPFTIEDKVTKGKIKDSTANGDIPYNESMARNAIEHTYADEDVRNRFILTGYPDTAEKSNTANKLLDFADRAKFAALRYVDFNITPQYWKEMSQWFKDKIYKYGNGMLNSTAWTSNTIMKQANWEEAWNALTPEEQTAFGIEKMRYADALYYGKLDKELTREEFIKWAKLNPMQAEMFNRMQKAIDMSVMHWQVRTADWYVDLDKNLHNKITTPMRRDLYDRVRDSNGSPIEALQYPEKLDTETKAEFKDREKAFNHLLDWHIQNTPEIRRAVADYLAERKFSKLRDGNTYFNDMRPMNADYFYIWADKDNPARTTKADTELGRVGKEKMFTYAETKADADAIIERLKQEGFGNIEAYQGRTILDDKGLDKFQRLSAPQLMQLIDSAHVDPSSPQVQKLLDAALSNAEQHLISKDWTPGMKSTSKEIALQFLTGLKSFIRTGEHVYGFGAMRAHINEAEIALEALQRKSGLSAEDMANYQKALKEVNYARKYYNQLRLPDSSPVIDNIRKTSFAFTLGAKPSFYFQNALEIFQKLLPNAVLEHTKFGGTTGEAINNFNSATIEATRYAIDSILRNKNMKLQGTPMDEELRGYLDDVGRMNKLGASGIDELLGTVNQMDEKYSGVPKRVQDGFVRLYTAFGRGVEEWTRLVAAISYYKMGKARGIEGKELVDYMADGVDQAVALWGKGGRAPVFDPKDWDAKNNPVLVAAKKSFLLYKTFSFSNYSQWRVLMSDPFAKQALMVKTISSLGMSGIKGMPLAVTVFALGGLFSSLWRKDDGKDKDLEYSTWALAKYVDEKMGNIPLGSSVMYGAGASAGLDFSQMLGNSTPLITDLLASAWSNSWDSKMTEITFGSPVKFTKDMINGIGAVGERTWSKYVSGEEFLSESAQNQYNQRVLAALPVSLRNVIRAYGLGNKYVEDITGISDFKDMRSQGVTVRGVTQVFPEDISTYDVLMKALSFPTMKITDAYALSQGGDEHSYNMAKKVISEGRKYLNEISDKLRLNKITNEEYESEKERTEGSMKHAIEIRDKYKEVSEAKKQRRIELKNIPYE